MDVANAAMDRCKPSQPIHPRSTARRLAKSVTVLLANQLIILNYYFQNQVEQESWNHTAPSPTHLSQEKGRFLTGDEMIASQILPVTPTQALACGAPVLQLGGLSNATKAKMAGNSMSAPCVGLMLLVAAVALELR